MRPGSPFGPGIASVVTYLHACQMVSYSRMTEVLDGLFGLKLSEGAIANMLARAAKPFAANAADIAETVRQSPVIASDEKNLGACVWKNALAVDVRRSIGGVPYDCADARQGSAGRVPRRSAAQGVALGSPRRAVPSRTGASVFPRSSHP